MKSKILPTLILIMSFSGFLSSQIMWDSFNLNAKQPKERGENYSVYETSLQGLKLTALSGAEFEVASIKEPILMLNFWASWCQPCLQEFPNLVKFQEAYKGKVRVLGINGDEEDALLNVKKIQKRYGLNFESFLDVNSRVGDLFKIDSYPVTIGFYKGKVFFINKKIHDFMDKEFLKTIDQQLGKSSR